MNINKKLFTLIAIGLITLGISSLYYLKTSHAQAFRGIIIDEYIMDLGNVEPGTSITQSFTIIHDYEDKDEVVLNLRAYNFIPDGVTGTPNFILDEDLPDSIDLASWITFEQDEIVLPEYGDEKEVVFTINVPANVEPGGKYAAIFPLDLGGDRSIAEAIAASPQVGINGAPGPLVLLSTGGDQSINIFTEDLYTSNIKDKKTKFFFNTPVNVTAVLNNNGNVYTKPRGAVYIYRGDSIVEPIATLELNDKNGYVLGNSTREFKVTWNESFIRTELKVDDQGSPVLNENGEMQYKTVYDWDNLSKIRIGKYNVKLMYFFTDLEGNQVTREANTYIILFPWQIIVLIIIVLTLIILFILRKLIKHRRNRKTSSRAKFTDYEPPQNISLGRVLQQ